MSSVYVISIVLMLVGVVGLAVLGALLVRSVRGFTSVRSAALTVFDYELGTLRARRAALRVAFQQRKARRASGPRLS